jgi:phage tail sheath protein FI
MPEYLYPGVYVEELDTGNKPITGVSTSTVGFLGIAERGPVAPMLITSFGDYQRSFGSYLKDPDGTDHYLAYAVEGFFQNGGLRCFVQRVVHADAAAAANAALAASAAVGNNLTITAVGPGAWSNRIAYQVGKAGLADATLFKLTLFYWAGTPPADFSNPTTIETFDNLSSVSTASTFYESEINNVSNLVMVKQKGAGSPAVMPKPVLLANGSDGLGAPNLNLLVGATAGLTAPTALTEAGTLILTAAAATVTFTVNQAAGPIKLVSDLITAVNADAVVGAKASLDAGGHLAIQDPANRGNLQVTGTLAAVGPGNVGAFAGTPTVAKLTAADFQGSDVDPANKSGLLALGDVDEISLLCCPDEYYLGPNDTTVAQALQQQCELLKDRFAILQAPVGVQKPDNNNPSVNSKYAAYYYPWLSINNAVSGVPMLVPPCGHIAGIYARSDNNVGVQKDPANEVINGITQLQLQTNDQTQAILNPKGVNVLRYFKGAGNLVWGGRTTSNDPDWTYVNVRRIFIFVEKSIKRGTQWVVFDINNEPTWARVRRSIGDFLTGLWRDGVLQGTKKEEAFFVTCDRTTMTQADIDTGKLICVIGIAPVKPAEFVIFRIGQWNGGTDVSEQ